MTVFGIIQHLLGQRGIFSILIYISQTPLKSQISKKVQRWDHTKQGSKHPGLFEYLEVRRSACEVAMAAQRL